ncbi:MAG TPA: tetratricopeptide repeat protein [Polyangiaceae bacterium]|jgi:TPR repeat protein
MKVRSVFGLGGLASLATMLGGLGCAELGAAPVTTLPPDLHALPTASEVADHPCRYEQVDACIARCEQDSTQCNATGVMFEFDQGVHSDPAVASEFYGRACNGNYAPGCNNLAWLYLRGSGVPRDQPHAMLLFMAAFDSSKLACLKGDPSSCLLAGELLYDEHVAPKEGETAVAYFRRACDAGDAHGCELAKQEE